MTGPEFLASVTPIFQDLHFNRRGKDYYCTGDRDVMVIIHPQKSGYGTVYYFNVYFALKEYDQKGKLMIPDRRNTDTYGRIPNGASAETTYSFDYSESETTDEVKLKASFTKYANEVIFPTLSGGVEYILTHPEVFSYGWLSPRLQQMRDNM